MKFMTELDRGKLCLPQRGISYRRRELDAEVTHRVQSGHRKRNGRSQKLECYDGCAEIRSWTRSEMKEYIRGTTKVGEIKLKESTGKKVEVVWACDAKRGTLRRKDGDGKRGRPIREDGWTK